MQKEKRLHENFWTNVLKDFKVETRTQANSRETILTAVEIFDARHAIDEKTSIFISAALAPYVRNFSYLEIEGEGLDQKLGEIDARGFHLPAKR